MLEVNKIQYETSLKKFKGYAQEEKKRKNMTLGNFRVNGEEVKENKARSLKQVWQVLNLDKVLEG
jgi:hypothetical protein